MCLMFLFSKMSNRQIHVWMKISRKTTQIYTDLWRLWCYNLQCTVLYEAPLTLFLCLTWRCPRFELHPGPVRTERAAPAPRAVFGLGRARSASPWSPPERCRTETGSRWRSGRDQSLPKLAFSNPTDMKCIDCLLFWGKNNPCKRQRWDGRLQGGTGFRTDVSAVSGGDACACVYVRHSCSGVIRGLGGCCNLLSSVWVSRLVVPIVCSLKSGAVIANRCDQFHTGTLYTVSFDWLETPGYDLTAPLASINKH